MITKPEQHEIDRAGKRLLHDALERIGWVVNDVQEDYGIDYNIQVFDEKSPTGAWFHVQLKSSSKSEYSADATFISQEISVDHVRHYASELRQPICIIHADTATARVYWYFPQLDQSLINTLSTSVSRTTTVRIPTTQELPITAADLLVDLEKAYVLLASRELTSVTTRFFAESLQHFPDQEALARAFHEKNDTLKLTRIRDLYQAERFDEARARAELVVVDPDSTVEIKFWAQIQLYALEYREVVHSGKPQSELPKTTLSHAIALQKLTRLGPKHLKFYSLITRHAAELEIMVHQNFSLLMAIQQQLGVGRNPVMAIGLHAHRAALVRRIVTKYNRCIRLARYAANYSDRWVLGRALTNIVKAIAPFIGTLRSERDRHSELAFAQSALQVCKLAAWISAETEDSSGIVIAISSALITIHGEDCDAFHWAEQTTQSLRDPSERAEASRLIDRAKRRWKGDIVEGDYQGDTIWQIIQNIATGIGIDISDESSPFVRQLRIAARDNSPERVLVNCEHLLAARGAMGPHARHIHRLLGIDTAGSVRSGTLE